MAVIVNTTRLLARLNKFVILLPGVAALATITGATEMRKRVQEAVRNDWVNNNQVGFDIDHFLSIIQQVEAIPGGGLGILNVEKMGTAADLEKIAHVRGLYHQKTRQGDKFGLFIRQMGMFFDQVAELAANRQARWGDTEPQWWLIEHGTIGTPGAYAPRAPTNTISVTGILAQPMVFKEVTTAVDSMLKSRGIIS